jgi:hypothetical protein
MALREQCPNCEKLPVVRGPGRVICPKCRHIFQVPDLGDGLLPAQEVQTSTARASVAAEPVPRSSMLLRVLLLVICCLGLLGGAVGLAFLLAPQPEPDPLPKTTVTATTEPAPTQPAPALPPTPQPTQEEVEINRLREELAQSKEEQSRLEEEKLGGQSELLILQAKVRRLEETVADQKKQINRQDATLSKERQERAETEGALKTQLQLSEAVATVRAEQIQDLKKAKVREEEPEPPQETDPRVRAALIGIAQKMKKDIDARAWAKLELHEREAVDEVLYRFAQSRLHHGNGLDALSAKDVEFMKKAGLAGYVRMEEARRRPKK